MIQLYTRDLLAKSREQIPFPPGIRLEQHMREMGKMLDGHRIFEFIGTDTFGPEWTKRQQFEIDAGRDEEPILYTPLYQITANSGLPKTVDVSTMGPGGVVFEEVFEGGEVKFSGVTSGQYSIGIRHWATGLEYSKDLVIYNQTWNIAVVERQMGVAHNALLNHLHLNPIIAYGTTPGYPAANKTAAVTSGATTTEDWLLTLEAAITHSKADPTNPRRGPYYLLASTGNVFSIERMLIRTPQLGTSIQAPSALDAIRGVIAYDGWTGKRGNKSVTYPGVATGKAYLISQQYRGQDFQSFEKQGLQNEGQQVDLTRFMTQQVWDSYYGVYANPLRSVEEITWP
jgi:hypothetical protein